MILSTLVVNEYNPTWSTRFVEERQRLQARIGEFVEEIHTTNTLQLTLNNYP